MLVIAGGSDAISSVFRQTILQTATPDDMRGRLQGVFIVVVAGGPRLGEAMLGGAGGEGRRGLGRGDRRLPVRDPAVGAGAVAALVLGLRRPPPGALTRGARAGQDEFRAPRCGTMPRWRSMSRCESRCGCRARWWTAAGSSMAAAATPSEGSPRPRSLTPTGSRCSRASVRTSKPGSTSGSASGCSGELVALRPHLDELAVAAADEIERLARLVIVDGPKQPHGGQTGVLRRLRRGPPEGRRTSLRSMFPSLLVYVDRRSGSPRGAAQVRRPLRGGEPEKTPRFAALVRTYIELAPADDDPALLEELKRDPQAIDAFSIYLRGKADAEAVVTLTEESDLVLGVGLYDPDDSPEVSAAAEVLLDDLMREFRAASGMIGGDHLAPPQSAAEWGGRCPVPGPRRARSDRADLPGDDRRSGPALTRAARCHDVAVVSRSSPSGRGRRRTGWPCRGPSRRPGPVRPRRPAPG